MGLALGLALIAAGCGKKGAPLAPLVRMPAAVADLKARRLGSDVHLQFTIPATNVDGSGPADLDRIEVYAYTGRPPNDAAILKYGTVVGTVQVRRPPPRQEEEDETAPPKPAPPPGPGVDQGAEASVVETLTPAAFELTSPRAGSAAAGRSAIDAGLALPLWAPVVEPPPVRLYAAVGMNRKGRRGPLSPRATLTLVEPPPAPAAAEVTYAADAITVTWPQPDTRRPVQEPASEEMLASRAIGDAPPTRTYNIYDVTPAAAGPAPESGAPRPPRPLNDEPLAATTYRDSRLEFGVERCYGVRAVAMAGEVRVESAPSPAACVTPRDTFPPAAPASFAAVAAEGAISLIWEANTEKDLAGYLVLRGEAPGETLRTLTPAPIRETTYRDTTVQRGVRYVYVVVAVDTATPQNVSAQSDRVEETAR